LADGDSDFRTQTSEFRKLVRHATDLAEGDHVSDESGDKQPRFASDREQNARAQNHTNQQVDQNRQSQFHYNDYKSFVEPRKLFN